MDDIDVGVLAKDTENIYALGSLIKQRCGYHMIHRRDVEMLPNLSAFVIKVRTRTTQHTIWHTAQEREEKLSKQRKHLPLVVAVVSFFFREVHFASFITE